MIPERSKLNMEALESSVPPGFRFHPTEEELVGYYLKRKVSSQKIDLDVIIDIDLYRIEPWDIQDRCKLGYEEQNEWYFFSYKDRKYPTGTRTNRATAAGFWKATGRDKAVLSKESIIGMRKTLVFYKGRAPTGRKTDWIMHEYRLQTSEHGPPQEEGWVVCRAFKKPTPNHQQGFDHVSHYRTPSHHSISTTTIMNNPGLLNHIQAQPSFPPDTFKSSHNPFEEIPKLDSSSISASFTMGSGVGNGEIADEKSILCGEYSEWKNWDGLLRSQVIVPSSYAYTNMALVPRNDELDASVDYSFSDM